jgi:hypothetical protein
MNDCANVAVTLIWGVVVEALVENVAETPDGGDGVAGDVGTALKGDFVGGQHAGAVGIAAHLCLEAAEDRRLHRRNAGGRGR